MQSSIPSKLIAKPNVVSCPNCGSTDTVAVYICPSCKTSWRQSGPGRDAQGRPVPDPCPGCTTNTAPIPAVSLICNTCGAVTLYGRQPAQP